jgi:hypothetical protein
VVSARRWHPSLTSAQLGAAISFGLLVKLSTPAYVAAPAGVALVLSSVATRRDAWGRWWLDARFLVSASATVVLTLLTAAWYRVNFDTAWKHAELAATSTLWGVEESLGWHVSFWLMRARRSPIAFDVALLGLTVAAVSLVLVRRRHPRVELSRCHALVLLGCLGGPAFVLPLLASQANVDPEVSDFLCVRAVGLRSGF